jgi:hypothetical protein
LPDGNINSFELLKQKIVATMQQSYPGISPVMADWRSQEITDFQEELRVKVNARVSEKWFYNHFKQQNPAFPRIDMLNLLSRYAGYLNWDDFLYRTVLHENQLKKVKSANRVFIIIPLLVGVVVLVLYLVFRMVSFREYHLRFYDSLTKENIHSDKIEITLFPENQPVATYLSDNEGKVIIKTDKRDLKMLISAPYYKTDTFKRIVKTFNRLQKIGLQPDEFSRMIQYFSEMDIDNWQKRRASLDSLIDNGALICRVGSGSRKLGVELFTKQEFIDKVTMPSGSLKNLEILETQMKNQKIVILRFRIIEKIR